MALTQLGLAVRSRKGKRAAVKKQRTVARTCALDLLRPSAVAGIISAMEFTIRAASASDAPSMHRVRAKVRENRLSDPQRVTEAAYLPYIQAGTIWVAEADGSVIGFAGLDGPSRSVWALFVDPDAEGAGVGRALHERMLLSAKERRLARLTLSTEEGTRAARFYQQAGWREIGTTTQGEALFEMALLN
jgi:GNAT superfamily N-acetyltransferase